ncbi:hypothetical protein ACU42Y_05830 [Proteus mirabilis]
MSWSEFKSQYLIRFWKPLPAVIAAGILSTYYFGLTGTFGQLLVSLLAGAVM